MNQSLLINCLYVTAGCAMVLLNGPFIATVFKHEILRDRKEYVLFAGLASADVIAGLTTLGAGAYRIHLERYGLENVTIARRECIVRTLIPSIAAIGGQALFLLAISIDRFLAVFLPLKYFTWHTGYSWSIIGICYFTTLVFIVFGVVSATVNGDEQTSPYCVGSATVDETFFIVWYEGRLLLVAFSVILYAFIMRKLEQQHCPKMSISSDNTITSEKRMTFLRRVTITVGITVGLTLVLYLIPGTAVVVIRHLGHKVQLFGPIAWLLNCVNAMSNLFVYLYRHADLRRGLLSLLLGKRLPTMT